MDYREQRSRRERTSFLAGIAVTVSVHAVVVLLCGFSGLKYIYPPPEEQSVLIEFEVEQIQDPLHARSSTQPRSLDADPTQPINLVKRAEAQFEGTKANEAREATLGQDGDVEVPEPPREKEIDRRALFHSANNQSDKDTLAPQTSIDPNDKLSEGHASGNAKTGKTLGEPNARLKGRTVQKESLQNPRYTVQEEGVVVVKIWVDQHGNVTRAIAGAEGTTVSNKELWNAARKAAVSTHFNMAADAPVLQEGTITYNFKLK